MAVRRIMGLQVVAGREWHGSWEAAGTQTPAPALLKGYLAQEQESDAKLLNRKEQGKPFLGNWGGMTRGAASQVHQPQAPTGTPVRLEVREIGPTRVLPTARRRSLVLRLADCL